MTQPEISESQVKEYRAKIRSKTFSGIAAAMAEQWGKLWKSVN